MATENPLNLTGSIIAGAGLYDQADRVGDIGQLGKEELYALGEQAKADTEFKPYGLTTSSGSTTTGVDGTTDIQLSEALQGLTDQQQAGAGSLFGSALGSQEDRIASAYEAIRATQRPGEERAAGALDSRLTGQGRSGIRSAAYGGSPEQLAQAKAIAESKNSASLAAIGEARTQQAQDANIGNQMLKGSLIPEAQMGNLLGVNQQNANLAQTGQIAGANLYSQLGLGGTQSQINAEKVRAELIGGLFDTVGGAASDAGFDPITALLDSIFK